MILFFNVISLSFLTKHFLELRLSHGFRPDGGVRRVHGPHVRALRCHAAEFGGRRCGAGGVCAGGGAHNYLRVATHPTLVGGAGGDWLVFKSDCPKKVETDPPVG